MTRELKLISLLLWRSLLLAVVIGGCLLPNTVYAGSQGDGVLAVKHSDNTFVAASFDKITSWRENTPSAKNSDTNDCVSPARVGLSSDPNFGVVWVHCPIEDLTPHTLAAWLARAPPSA